MPPLYYECHINIDPPKPSQVEEVERIAAKHNFRLAKLFMRKDGSQHQDDAFMTAKHKYDYRLIQEWMVDLIAELQENGYTVRRYKIETAVIDSKVNDVCHVL